MTDLFRGYDLTTVLDTVSEKRWTAAREDALKNSVVTPEEYPDWENLSAVHKRNFKESLLPVVTDVLEALESDQVKPTEAKQMVDYDYLNADRKDPRFYENQPEQHDTATATVWALHLHVHPSVADAVLERMSVMPETTGEFTFGDSWRQWGEPTEGEHDGHMVVYFHATPVQAAAIGFNLANHATFAAMTALGGDNADIAKYAVSTSGDYAEQLPNL